jgi:hypothetical protein
MSSSNVTDLLDSALSSVDLIFSSICFFRMLLKITWFCLGSDNRFLIGDGEFEPNYKIEFVFSKGLMEEWASSESDFMLSTS